MDEIKSLLDDINTLLNNVSKNGDMTAAIAFYDIISRLSKAAGLDNHMVLRCGEHNSSEAGKTELFFVQEDRLASLKCKGQECAEVVTFENRYAETGGCTRLQKCSYDSMQQHTDASSALVCDVLTGYASRQNYMQTYISKITPKTADISTGKLTDRELEVLKWAKEGKSYWETSVIMDISERTVKFHLSNIYRKLNAVNRSQAIAVAVAYGYL